MKAHRILDSGKGVSAVLLALWAAVPACGSGDVDGYAGPLAKAGSGGGDAGKTDGAAASAGKDGGQAGSSGVMCKTDAECSATPATPWCNTYTGKCVVCEDGNPAHGCSGGQSCCLANCVMLDSDPANCGVCGQPCNLPHAMAGCTAGQCTLASCETGFEDCDSNAANGCETAVTGGQGCVCTAGQTQPCYDGVPGTEGIGECKGGTKTCLSNGAGYGMCEGAILPIKEICGNSLDDDCNGVVDDSVDADGDGWKRCDGDCCDTPGPACGSPVLVNPGAVEVTGDNVDNDCDGQVDEDPSDICSNAAKFDAITADELLAAMELCAHSQNGSWGIVSASISKASGGGTIDNNMLGVLTDFGTNAANNPQKGPTMASLSSGHARDSADPEGTVGMTYTHTAGTAPADFLAPHGGQLPKTSPSCPNGTTVNDDVMLQVELKVPTNAQSFSFNFRFFSQEYWTYTCTMFNDFFITMLDSAWVPGPGQTPIPADKNICFDNKGSYISVNSNQFFTVCTPKSGYACADGTGPLAGTGYNAGNAGATAWLTTTAPVVPGETIKLRFAIWDTSDMALDSLVLIDNFRWSAQPSDGPITEQ